MIKKVTLLTLSGHLYVRIQEVIGCKSHNKYPTFYLIERKIVVVSKTLKVFGLILMELGFFRAHNSHLINLAYFNEYLRGKDGKVKMEDGRYAEVSRRRKDEFLKNIR